MLTRLKLLVLAIAIVPLAAATITFTIATPPAEALYPTQFSMTVPNYVLHCDGTNPVTLTVTASGQTQVSVDGQPAQRGTFTASVHITFNQAFTVVGSIRGQSPRKTYTFRCLPLDFQPWTFSGSGTPVPQTYLVQPSYPHGAGTVGRYTIFFDAYGTPVWWNKTPFSGELYAAVPLNATTLAWTNTGTGVFSVHGLDASLERTIGVPAPYIGLNFHEFQPTPDGNYLAIADINRRGWNLTLLAAAYPQQYHNPAIFANVTIADRVVVKLSPSGQLLWAWDSARYIKVDEMIPSPRFAVLSAVQPNDVYHMNAVEPTSTGFLVSYRHLDAVYSVNMQDPKNPVINWKLGGTRTALSLTVLNDPESGQSDSHGPVGPLSGQHDARMLADGTVTIYDNNAMLSSPPRAVRYAINTTAMTATLLESISDAAITSSGFHGSARKLANGNWLINWGANPAFAEYTPTGGQVFKLNWGTYSAYRAIPVPDAKISMQSLVNGMNRQFPR